MKGKQRLLALLFSVVAAVSILVVGTLAACGGKKPGKDSGSDSSQIETQFSGKFYLASEEGGKVIELDMKENGTYTLKIDATTTTGTYVLDGAKLNLSVDGEIKFTAEYNGENVVLVYDGNQYVLIVDEMYTVTFKNAEGFMPNGVKIRNGQKLGTDKPEKEGYVFVAWFTDEACTKLFSWNTVITGNLTLYAKFDSLSSTEYNVTYYDGGEVVGTGRTSGKALTAMPDGGDGFIGWWMSDTENANELSRQVAEGTALTGDTALYAVYEADKKLTVSVEDGKVKWSKTGNHAKTTYVVTVAGTAKSFKNVTEASLADFGSDVTDVAGKYTVSITATYSVGSNRITYEGKAAFCTNRLAKPSNLKVEGLLFSFGGVENATDYKLKINLGDRTIEEDLVGTTYDLSELEMPANNITFTVYATAEGYMDSLENTYEYETLKLDAVSGLTYDAASKKVKWNAVANAGSYEVTVTSENGTQTYTVASAELDLNAAGVYGTFTVAVTAKAKGHYSPAATTAEFTRAELAAPQNMLYTFDGTTEKLTWSAVNGATGYELTVSDLDKFGKTGLSKKFTIAAGSTEYVIPDLGTNFDRAYQLVFSLVAKSATAGDSVAAEYVILGGSSSGADYSSADFTYSNGLLTWKPVRKVASYELTLPDGTKQTVNGTSYEGVKLVQSGRNEMSLAYTRERVAKTFDYSVNAFAVTFITNASGVATIYAADGDTVTLPSGEKAPYKPGYNFSGWFNSDQATATEYGETLTIKGNALFVYAKWANAQYKITFDVNGGKALPEDQDEATVTYLTSDVTLENGWKKLPVPEVGNDTSKLFLGWYTAPGGAADKRFADMNGLVTTTYKYTFGSTLYAYWAAAFEFEPNKTKKDDITGQEEVLSYMVKKGPEMDSFRDEVVTVPATYLGKPVDYIASYAFSDCRFRVLNIPDSIYTIELLSTDVGSAFAGCSDLEAINVYKVAGGLSQDKRYFSEGGVLYFENETQVTEYDKTEVAYVPRQLTGTIVIPDTVEIIPMYVFGSNNDGSSTNSHYYTGIVIPWSVKEIQENAFVGATKLLTVEFEETPADKLSEEEPLNVEALAFAKCTSLLELSLPSRLSAFTPNIIDGCTKITAIYIGAANKYYTAKEGVVFSKDETELVYYPRGLGYVEGVEGSDEYVIPEGVKKIASNAFSGSLLRKVTIASSVTEIAPYAFSGVGDEDGKSLSGKLTGNFKGSGCSKLEEVVFAEGVSPLSIGEGAFYVSGTNEMASFTLPRNLYKIGAYAFAGRTKMTAVNIDLDPNYTNGLTIDYDVTAFATGMANLTPYVVTLKLAATVPVIDNLAGMFGSTKLVDIDVDGNPNYRFDDMVLYDNAKTKILYFLDGRTGAYVVPETVTRIEAGTFRGKKYLTEITIHAGVEYIGDEAFKNCGGLVRVEILNADAGAATVELNFGDDVFYGCDDLVEVELSNRVRKIGKGLFKGAKALTEIVIPEGVVELGDEAFSSTSDYSYNDGLRKVTLPSTLKKFGTYGVVDGKDALVSLNAFFNCRVLEEIVVGEGNRYFEASNGVLYANVDPDSDVGEKQLIVCAAAADGVDGTVTVVKNVTKIWANAFRNNAKIKSIIFEDSDMEGYSLEIGENAFLGCKLLETVKLPVGLTEILSDTFKNCETLKEVVVPYTVTKIDGGYYKSSPNRYGAFNNCKSLEKITFQETPADKTPVPLEITDGYFSSNTYGTEYIYGAFMACPALTSIEFPERMTYLGEVTFRKSNIKSVVLPSTLKSVGYGAFYGATKLESVTFRTNAEGKTELTAIGPSMFSNSNLKSIDIPEGVTDIDYYAFSCCYELTSVKLPSTLVSIGTKANSGCSAGTVKPSQSIGRVFWGATKLTEVIFKGDSQLETIEEYSFYMVAAKKLELPATLKKLGDYAFEQTKLEEVTFATKATEEGEAPVSALEYVGKYAFKKSSLMKISFPETGDALPLGSGLFDGCTNLRDVYLPSTVESITAVFDGCKSNFELTISENNPKIQLHKDDNALIVNEIKTTDDSGKEVTYYSVQFAYKQITAADGGTTEYRLPSDVVEIGANAFAYQTSITKLIIPSGVITIGAGAFHDCTLLQEVEFEYTDNMNQLTTLGASGNSYGVFQNCYSLSKIVLPNNALNVDSNGNSQLYQYTFNKCLSVEKVGVTPAFDEIANLDGGIYLPSNLVVLGEKPENTSSSVDGVFGNCFNLKEVTLPASIKTIGHMAFAYCYALDTITYVGATEEGNALSNNIETLGSGAFTYTTSLKTIKLPKNSKLEKLPIFIFEYGGLETITIPGNIKYVGNGTASTTTAAGAGRAFKNCYNLTEVKFETDANGKAINNVQLFGQNTFEGTAITEMDMSSAISLGTSLFANCTKLETVKLSNKLVMLPTSMFSGCTSFTGVKMNKDGTVAYDNDGNYQYTLELPESLVFTGTSTFKNSGLIAIKIPKNVTALTSSYNNAKVAAKYANYNADSSMFYGCTALESVIFEGKVTHVGKNAFYLCSSLEEVLAPDSESNYTADGFFGGLVFAGDFAFKGTAIKRVTLDSAERFGNELFMDSAVEEVYISQGMRYNGGKSGGWGSRMFKNCVNLKGVKCDADGNPVLNEDGSYTYTLVLPDNEYYFGANTFENTGVKVVKFGSGVTTIGSNATNSKTYNGSTSMFMNCVDLEKVIFEDSKIKQICGTVFKGCTNLTTVVGMENVDYIGSSAFAGTAVGTLNFAADVELGANAFEGCKSLTSVTFADTQTKKLGNKAFYECSNLATFNLPDGITEIGEDCFNGTAYSGETLQLPKKLKTLGNGAFWGLGVKFTMADDSTDMKVVDGVLYSKDGNTLYVVSEGFTGEVDLSNVTEIGQYAFAFADGVTGIKMPGGEVTLDMYAFAYARIPASVDMTALLATLGTLPTKAFQYATGLGDLVIPEGFKLHTELYSKVNNSPTGAFWGSDITSVVIPSSMVLIPNDTFKDCTQLTSVTFGAGVEEIRYRVFQNTGLTEVYIPATVNYFHGDVFKDCANLKKVEFGEGTVRVGATDKFTVYSEGFKQDITYNALSASSATGGYATFLGCAVETLILPSTVQEIGPTVFSGNNITELVLPEGLKAIGKWAFTNNAITGNVTIPATCTSIGDYAFEGNDITSLTFAKNEDGTSALTTIGAYAFNGNMLSGKLEIPAGVTTIGKYAFAGRERTEVLDAEGNGTGEYDYTGCSTVTEIVLPATYVVLDEGTFANYYNLAKINLESIQKLYQLALSYAGSLNDTGLELTFGALTYVGATIHSIDTDTGEITGLGNGPLGYANVAKITFLNEESVMGKLLHSFTTLPEFVFPEGLTELPSYFYAYTFIKEITVPAFVETMGSDMFNFSVYLTKVTFEEGSKLTTMGNFAFANCPNLASLTLPETLESIGTWAFRADLSLKSVVLPYGTSIGSYATSFWKADQTLYVRTPKAIAYAYLAYDFNYTASKVLSDANIVLGYNG